MDETRAMVAPQAIEPAAAPLTGVQRFHRIAGATLAFVLLILGVWTLREFLPALAWAAVIAVGIWPIYDRAKKRSPEALRPIVLPAGFTLAIALVFIIPLIVFGLQFSREAESLIRWFGATRNAGFPMPDWLANLPLVGTSITAWWHANLSATGHPEAIIGRLNRGELFTFSRDIGAQLVRRVVIFTFTVVTLFFTLKNGDSLRHSLMLAAVRLFGTRGELLGRQIVASIRGTVDGLVLVGLGEGLALGIAYYVTGVPHPTLFGAATAVAAIIPFGAPLVFTIASLLLLFQGSTVGGIAVFAFGLVVLGVADHVIRPVVIGSATRLPFLWVLLGILGGVETWGLLGLFLGPAIMAALILLWREWTSPSSLPSQD